MVSARTLAPLLLLALLASFTSARLLTGNRNHNNHNNHAPRMTSAGISQDQCKANGAGNGGSVASKACTATAAWCASASRVFPAAGPFATLSDCGHAAESGCINAATNRNTSPCGVSMRNGQGSCTQDMFMDFYKFVARAECNKLSVGQ